MAKMRSPNYPSVGLDAAISMVRSFWDKEKRTAVPEEVAARAIGYKSLSGPARSRLAALKKYGLLEGDGANVKVSTQAIRILFPTSDDAKREALREAALSPELFKDLHESHGESSDHALTAYLIQNLAFSPIGAKRAIGAFRDTVRVANLDDAGYSGAGETPEGEATMSDHEVAGRHTPTTANPATLSFSWPLSKELRAEVRFTGGTVKPEDIEILTKYLALAKAAIDRVE